MKLYSLNSDGEPEECPNDTIKWAKSFASPERIVAKDKISDSEISTVFLGVDYSLSGAPILWETMIFGGELDGIQTRCGGTRGDARKMHEEMKIRVLGKLN